MPEADVHAAIASGEMGFLHSFTTGSAVDGPGVRVVGWTAGCNLRCVYCMPWNMRNGMPVTIQRATEELSKYRHGLKVMSGGFTLSGGEPLLQHKFAVKLFRAARAMGIHTALDTNGYLGERLNDEDLEAIDLVLLDLKSWSVERHNLVTGVDPDAIQSFARRLAALQRPMWVRFVFVPGWTDNPGEIFRIAAFAASLGNVQRVDVLPFHQMGRYKWKELGMEYQLQDVQPPSKEAVERVCAQFRSAGLKAY